MTVHDFGVPKTHPKSISKSMPKTARFWTLLGLYFGSLLASRWLQHGFQSSQDGSKTTRERPKRALYASRTAPAPPKTPPGPLPAHPSHLQGSPRASKTAQGASKAPPRALQKRFLRPQIASKSSPEEPSKPPALGLQPLASGLQMASAGSAKR